MAPPAPTGSRLWKTLAAAGSLTLAPFVFAQTAQTATPTTPPCDEPEVSPLMAAVERAASNAVDPGPARLRLLGRIQLSNACYPSDMTPEQLDAMIARTNLLPPTAQFSPRFYADTTAWLGAGQIGPTNTSRPAQLTYSFPDDGVMWGLTCSGFTQGPNDLNARLTAAFGSLDRGREMIRSSLAGWRAYGGLAYTEVPDDNSACDTSTTHVSTRGDIRIGGWGFVNADGANPLAYDAFPGSGLSTCAGGDMTINTNYFGTGYFTNTIGNFLQFRNTIAHEHGHGLGFIHSVPCNRTKLMEPSIHTGILLLSPDEIRAVIRNYGDRYATIPNHAAATAKDLGNLTTPVVRSAIERSLGLNGTAVVVNGNPPQFLSEDDYFRFTIDSTQSVTITATPTGYAPSGACCVSSTCTLATQVNCTGTFVLGGVCTPSPCTAGSNPTTCSGTSVDPTWCQAQQSAGCNGSFASIDAQKAGNLALQVLQSNGTTVLGTSDSPTLGVPETLSYPALAPGTYYVRIWDSGGANTTNQTVQTYDLVVRLGTSKAPPVAVAGVNKRVLANTSAYFIGNHNSYATETSATIPAANFAWDFDGDGVYDSAGAGQSQPTFTYRSNGVFPVTLKITDSNGLSATDTIQVTVYGATTSVSSISPSTGTQGSTVPVTINGANFKGVSAASQVAVSGGGITVSGTPVVNAQGTRITGLSFVIAAGAPITDRDVTITNSDGQGSSGGGVAVFSVTSTATTGACCAPAGSCTPVAPGSCSGTFQGNGTVCSPNPCPQPTLACCAASGACTIDTAANCTAAGGISQGSGSSCSPNPCPQPTGACCNGATCSVTAQLACTGANHRFAGVNASCNAAGNAIAPCCLANFNQDAAITVQDIFDYLNAWFGASPAADINGGGLGVQDIFDFLAAWFTGC